MAGVMDLIWPGAFVAQSIHVVDRLQAEIPDDLLLIPFHAASELDDDEISVLDVEQIIFTDDIIQRQRDPRTRERKCVIRGNTLEREAMRHLWLPGNPGPARNP